MVQNKHFDAVIQEVKDTSVKIICPDGTHAMKPLTVTTGYSPLLNLKDLDENPLELSNDGIAVSRKLT